MIAPMGELLSPPTQPVRIPRRDKAYATLYSPPPTHTSSSGANSILPCCGGESRSMHSPNATMSYLQSLASRIFIESPVDPSRAAPQQLVFDGCDNLKEHDPQPQPRQPPRQPHDRPAATNFKAQTGLLQGDRFDPIRENMRETGRFRLLGEITEAVTLQRPVAQNTSDATDGDAKIVVTNDQRSARLKTALRQFEVRVKEVVHGESGEIGNLRPQPAHAHRQLDGGVELHAPVTG